MASATTRVLVVARVAELLAEVALTDQHHADALDLAQHAREVLDRPHLLALDDHEDFSLGRERPDVGAGVVFLLREPPVARGPRRRVTSNPGRIVERPFSRGISAIISY